MIEKQSLGNDIANHALINERNKIRLQLQVLEKENLSLRNVIKNLESQMSTIELQAKSNYDSKIRKIASRLEIQSREREWVNRFREQNESEMQSEYERKIKALELELKCMKTMFERAQLNAFMRRDT